MLLRQPPSPPGPSDALPGLQERRPMPGARRWRRTVAALGMAALKLATAAPGFDAAAEPASIVADTGGRPVIVNPDVVWQFTNEQRAQAHPIRLEGRVNFADLRWRNFWFEHDGTGSYVALGANPPAFRAGQRVRIEGSWIPRDGLDASRVTVTVLEEFTPTSPLETKGHISEIRTFDRRVVTAAAYVDEQILIDDEHVRLHLIVDDRAVIGWVRPDDPRHVPDWTGNFVQLEALYSGRMDPTGTRSTVELWMSRDSAIRVIEPISTTARFNREITEIARLSESPSGTWLKVRGRIQQRETGASLVLRDETGEVLVESLQRQRLPPDTEVEIIGRLALLGARWVLADALFRRAPDAPPRPTAGLREVATGALRSVEQVRQLGREDAAQGRAVDLSGLVVWSLPEADFFYLQDLSGGIRVRLSPGQPKPALQKALRVEGTTIRGELGAAVVATTLHDLGSMAHPAARRITVERAMTGREEGQWVGLRGFIQRTVSDGDWRWIHVTGPDGEFIAHLQSPVDFVATPGSLIRVNGVCEATLDPRGRVSGVLLRVPFLHDITIEADAPTDPFALPLRPVAELRQMRVQNDMARARVSGVVLHRTLGESLVIQDGAAALKLLTRSTTPLARGDTIEAVGILGREGARTVLREVEYRTIASRPLPAPAVIETPAQVLPEFDERLVRLRARLVEVSRWPDRTRYTLQSGNTFFDALLVNSPVEPQGPSFAPGTGLELTGLCDIEYDDTQHVRGMTLVLRTPDDFHVFAPARFWTVQRLGLTLGIVAIGALLVIVWVWLLRSRVRRQTELIEQQIARQARLEAELERAQRLHSLGSLAGGIAHDFNNLLTAILGNVTFAMLDPKAMAAVGDSLFEVELGARRARDLTQQMITFAQGGEPARAPLELPPLLDGVAALALSGSPTRMEFHGAPELPPVFADKVQLGRALQSLLAHARVLQPRGGIVLVNAVEETVREGHAGSLAAGRYVRLTFAIPGVVVPPERLAGYFDPYVSSSPGDDRFALAIAYSIVKRHDGLLDVRSSASTGTVFRLWLPASDAVKPVVSATSGVARTPASNLKGVRVLVMDDELIIRRLVERYLRSLECEPRTVADGAECLQVYAEAAKNGRPFDVVVLDLTVPGGMGGKETITALRRLDPEVRAIVSSGYFNDPVLANFRDYGFCESVPKPYGVEALSDSLRRALGTEKA